MRVVFDLDGTLVDSAPDIRAAVNAMLAEEGKAGLDLATVTSFVGHGLPHLVGCVIRETGLDPARQAALTGRVLEEYEAVNGRYGRLHPRVRACLGELAEAGARMGLCTNKPEGPARDLLAREGIAAHFEAVVGGDTLAQKKPDPAPLRAVSAALGEGPLLYVGDSEIDAETARRAEVPFALFTRGYRKGEVAAIPHDLAFEDFGELARMIALRQVA